MYSSEPPNEADTPLVQSVLEPLLNDFQYWFSESKTLLTSPKADCLDAEQRQSLIDQVEATQQAVNTARTLLLATDGQAGVEPSLVMTWHQLVLRCWQAAQQIRQTSQAS
ncbi:MAG: DUF2605 domain-containing protein [Cyanobacteria bacterium J06636_28]